MPGTKDSQASLALRGKKIEELQELAIRFLKKPASEARGQDKQDLMSELSNAVAENTSLRRELRKTNVTTKPSFYLMVVGTKHAPGLSRRTVRKRLATELGKLNVDLKRRGSVPPYTGLRIEDIIQPSDDLLEAQLSWQRVHWYWKPDDLSYQHIYELRFGFVVLDFGERKAIVACQTQQERDLLAKALSGVFGLNLSPLILTKPILDQIGTFDRVKKAGYFVADQSGTVPSNIVYADENLSTKPVAREEEADPRSQRKHSFYRIPLGGVVEQGVGATSDSGKLWIPRETPLDTVREYAGKLLGKVGRTLNGMTRRGEMDEVLAAMGIPQMPPISAIKNLSVRRDVCSLLKDLVNMLLNGETERPFPVSAALATQGVPSAFNYPRLELKDQSTNDRAFWRDSVGSSQFTRVTRRPNRLILAGYPSQELIDLSKLRHPITGSPVKVDDPLACLHLEPTPSLHEALLSAIEHISSQVQVLSGVVSLPFRISAQVIRLDVDRAFGRSNLGALKDILSAADISEMQRAMSCRLKQSDETRIRRLLWRLGEECVHITDANCGSCLAQRRYLCLRSLVARYLRKPLLLAHKGIELSDIQGAITVAGQGSVVFGFAKLPAGQGGLTLRNTNGAKLLAQVLSQVDRSTFDTVMIISPGVINEDLRERLRLVCGLVGKRLVILDFIPLAKLLMDFEQQATFDGVHVDKVYRASKRKTRKR